MREMYSHKNAFSLKAELKLARLKEQFPEFMLKPANP